MRAVVLALTVAVAGCGVPQKVTEEAEATCERADADDVLGDDAITASALAGYTRVDDLIDEDDWWQAVEDTCPEMFD